jgi:hypothetical protein
MLFFFMGNLSKLKENVLTIYGAIKELTDTISVLAYVCLKSLIWHKSPCLYYKLANLRKGLTVRKQTVRKQTVPLH